MAYCLLDTNILLYLANSAATEHAGAKGAVTRMLAAGDRLVIAPQVLFEFWSVATRPAAANGLGWTALQTRSDRSLP
jgi:predicted nucleic acid-binding protein